MHDLLGLVGTIHRPTLLVKTARFAVDEYRRDVHLPRLLKGMTLPKSGETIMRLIEIEADLEDRRRHDSADYAFARHIDVLIALMGEVRLYRAAHPTEPRKDHIKESGIDAFLVATKALSASSMPGSSSGF